LTLHEPVVVAPFDRFVLRDAGRRSSVAGGVVLDAHPIARRCDVDNLRARSLGGPEDIPSLAVSERGMIERAELPVVTGSSAEPLDAVLLPSFVLSKERFDELATSVETSLRDFHSRERLAKGMPREDLRRTTAIADGRFFDELLDALVTRVIADGPLVRSVSHQIQLNPQQERARTLLLDQLNASGFSPPASSALEAEHGADLVRSLVDSGELVKVAPEIIYTAEQVERAKQLIAKGITSRGPLTATEIKELLVTTRKYVIPLLEYLDAIGATTRVGDRRRLGS
jgi:selenocysteine-specific elongation factor